MLISNLRSYILITHYKKVESNDELKEVENCTCSMTQLKLF